MLFTEQGEALNDNLERYLSTALQLFRLPNENDIILPSDPSMTTPLNQFTPIGWESINIRPFTEALHQTNDEYQGVKEGVWTPCGAPPPYGGSLSPARRRRGGGRSGGSAGRGGPHKSQKKGKNTQKHEKRAKTCTNRSYLVYMPFL